MSKYYPQGAISLRVRWEDFGNEGNALLNENYELLVQAKELMVEINDYNEADTFSCEIDYKTFPFDPRTIRACGVTVHIEDMKQFVKNNSTNIIQPSTENTVFQGFADEEGITFDDTERVVRLEGRDFTSLFVDSKYLEKPVSLSKPVDKIIQQLISSQAATAKITVDNRTGETLPTLAQLAPDFNEKTSVRNTKRKDTYWDVIQNVIGRAGLIGYIELDKFVITKPRVLYNREQSKLFVYGKNIKDLHFKRKLGRHKGFNIRVLSIDIEGKKLIEAKIPEDSKQPGYGVRVQIPQMDTQGKKLDPKDAPFLTFRVPDISSKEHLISIGEKIFEELGRQQIEGSFTTYEMEIPEKTGEENSKQIRTVPASFNTIRNGTPIEVYISQEDMEGVQSASTLAQKKRFLIQRQYPSDVADALANSMNRITTPFYTKTVKFNLSQTEGFKMDIEFINFIELENAKLGR